MNTKVGYQIRFTTGRVDSHSGDSQRFDASVFKGDALFGSIIEDQRQIRLIEIFISTSEKRLQRQENGLDAIDGGPLVLSQD